MVAYAKMSAEERHEELRCVHAQYVAIQAMGLSLNMARGKPAAAQLDLSTPLLTLLQTREDCLSEDGTDRRHPRGEAADGPPLG